MRTIPDIGEPPPGREHLCHFPYNGDVISPVGGDTLFANQYHAWEALPAATRSRLEGLQGIHSARKGYARDGLYGERDEGRSMAIRYSDEALATQLHPIARVHPETGRTALFVNPGYTIGIEGVTDTEALELMTELFRHQRQETFIYHHRWSPRMLLLWDNRCLLHAATGGYDGHVRLLHRITLAGLSGHPSPGGEPASERRTVIWTG